MRRRDTVTDQEVEAVMDRGRQIRPAPDLVRARLLARARAAVAAPTAAAPVAFPERPTAWHERRLAVAAAALMVLAAAGAGAALYSHTMRATAISPTPQRTPQRPTIPASAPEVPAAEPAPQLVSSSRLQRSHRSLSPQESYAAELDLLQRAQSNYASQDFPDALMLVAEHARRFPTGRLAEEREALRVRSLAGAGHGDEARRALAAFAKRFPRSAFLPRLREQARAADE
jgi:hypothetical protein